MRQIRDFCRSYFSTFWHWSEIVPDLFHLGANLTHFGHKSENLGAMAQKASRRLSSLPGHWSVSIISACKASDRSTLAPALPVDHSETLGAPKAAPTGDVVAVCVPAFHSASQVVLLHVVVELVLAHIRGDVHASARGVCAFAQFSPTKTTQDTPEAVSYIWNMLMYIHCYISTREM